MTQRTRLETFISSWFGERRGKIEYLRAYVLERATTLELRINIVLAANIPPGCRRQGSSLGPSPRAIFVEVVAGGDLIQKDPLAFYRCWTPGAVPIAALVRVAGMRWRIEENIQASKGLAALDEHQVRAWTSWHR